MDLAVLYTGYLWYLAVLYLGYYTIGWNVAMKLVYVVITREGRRWVPVAIYDSKIVAKSLAESYGSDGDVVETAYYPGTFGE